MDCGQRDHAPNTDRPVAIGDNEAMVGLTPPGGDAISRSARLESRDAASPRALADSAAV
jgi:hypothetical protein